MESRDLEEDTDGKIIPLSCQAVCMRLQAIPGRHQSSRLAMSHITHRFEGVAQVYVMTRVTIPIAGVSERSPFN